MEYGIRESARGIERANSSFCIRQGALPISKEKDYDVRRLRVCHPLAWFGILVFLLTTLGSVDGKVLCVGEDGHVALETADFHAYDRSFTISVMYVFPSGEHQTAGVASCCSHCGPCNDFPARSVDMLETFPSPSPEVRTVHPLPIALASLTDTALREAIPLPARQISRPDPTAVSHRNTVLLI
jgi:hypothetical protein